MFCGRGFLGRLVLALGLHKGVGPARLAGGSACLGAAPPPPPPRSGQASCGLMGWASGCCVGHTHSYCLQAFSPGVVFSSRKDPSPAPGGGASWCKVGRGAGDFTSFLAILTTFKCTVQSCKAYSHYCKTDLQNSLILQI